MAQDLKDRLSELSSTAWREIASEVEKDSVLFLDHGAAELLRWSYPGGAAALLEKGALNVYRLSKSPHRARWKSSAGKGVTGDGPVAAGDLVCAHPAEQNFCLQLS